MITDEIREELFRLRDEGYCEMQKKIIPTADPESVVGVRTPALRSLAKQMMKREDSGEFLSDLPHRYFDENQLHGFMISLIKDFASCMEETERFLPYVDNWATCDQMSPKVFGKHKKELLSYIKKWMKSRETYTLRFGIGMLMQHFLDEDFDPAYPKMVAKIRSREYYVNMMIAWYFATALAKQYESILPFIENRALDEWTHNKAIQKAVESYRISDAQKSYLKTLKIKKGKKENGGG
ncbi:MAG: DNA alkylation repair protein [Lachnospiraceae bacterium]|nr:DNA alkylation repair protein [Lachnospiraceae bacterium]